MSTSVIKIKGNINNNSLPVVSFADGTISQNKYLTKYLNAVYANGGVLSASELNAVNVFFSNTEDYDKILQLYAFIGDAKAACVPLVDNIHSYKPLSLLNYNCELEDLFHQTSSVIDGVKGASNNMLISSFCPNDLPVNTDQYGGRRFKFITALGGAAISSGTIEIAGCTNGSVTFGYKAGSSGSADYNIVQYPGTVSYVGNYKGSSNSYTLFFTRPNKSTMNGSYRTIETDAKISTDLISSSASDFDTSILGNTPFAIGAINGLDGSNVGNNWVKLLCYTKEDFDNSLAIANLLKNLGRYTPTI